MAEHETAPRANLLARMSRIEGQARGVRRMIEQGRDCAEIVHQVAAMRAALAKVALTVISENLEVCLRREIAGEDGDATAKVRQALLDLV